SGNPAYQMRVLEPVMVGHRHAPEFALVRRFLVMRQRTQPGVHLKPRHRATAAVLLAHLPDAVRQARAVRGGRVAGGVFRACATGNRRGCARDWLPSWPARRGTPAASTCRRERSAHNPTYSTRFPPLAETRRRKVSCW